MVHVKKCYVDENLQIIYDFSKLDYATGLANLRKDGSVEIVFLNPIASVQNLEQSIKAINKWGKKNGFNNVSLPSIDTCFIANSLCKLPELKDCHLGRIAMANPTSRNWYAKLNMDGKTECTDATEVLGNVYVSVLMSLKDFMSINPSSRFPYDFYVIWSSADPDCVALSYFH